MPARKPAILFLTLAAGCAATVPVPDKLRPDANESLAMVVPAKGDQIYECREAKWVFVAPEADLFDRFGKKIGRHYAGPHWESADGSKIAGVVKERAEAPAAGAIPWLLLSAKSVGPGGAFSNVTSIQRVSTQGGIAPAGASGETSMVPVPYSADYYFFTRQAEEKGS